MSARRTAARADFADLRKRTIAHGSRRHAGGGRANLDRALAVPGDPMRTVLTAGGTRFADLRKRTIADRNGGAGGTGRSSTIARQSPRASRTGPREGPRASRRGPRGNSSGASGIGPRGRNVPGSSRGGPRASQSPADTSSPSEIGPRRGGSGCRSREGPRRRRPSAAPDAGSPRPCRPGRTRNVARVRGARGSNDGGRAAGTGFRRIPRSKLPRTHP